MNGKRQIPLYLFAKAPVPGKVKTRMRPRLNKVQSAQLAAVMLNQSVEKVRKYWPGELILTVSPTQSHPVFAELVRNHQIQIERQVAGSLGARLLHVLHQGIKSYGCAVVMGCDVPHISAQILTEVHGMVDDHRNVIGPASDGGFYLLGLNQISSGIFEGVEWGGNQVLSQVCRNFNERNIALQRNTELRDIDNWDDLVWLTTQDQSYRGFVDGKLTAPCQSEPVNI